MASVKDLKDQLQALIDRTSESLDKVEAANAADAVVVAAQTHRLDFASLLLACIGILLAFGGVFAFFEIRYRAKLAAQETARTECRTIAQELLRDYVNDGLPNEVRRLVESINQENNGTEGDYGSQDTDQVKS